jgi:hypothetical protein
MHAMYNVKILHFFFCLIQKQTVSQLYIFLHNDKKIMFNVQLFRFLAMVYYLLK